MADTWLIHTHSHTHTHTHTRHVERACSSDGRPNPTDWPWRAFELDGSHWLAPAAVGPMSVFFHSTFIHHLGALPTFSFFSLTSLLPGCCPFTYLFRPGPPVQPAGPRGGLQWRHAHWFSPASRDIGGQSPAVTWHPPRQSGARLECQLIYNGTWPGTCLIAPSFPAFTPMTL